MIRIDDERGAERASSSILPFENTILERDARAAGGPSVHLFSFERGPALIRRRLQIRN